MSEYSLCVKGNIGLSDYSNINDYMCIVGVFDKLKIVIDISNSENIDIICSMLSESGFYISSKNMDKNGSVEIEAFRKNQIS